MTLPLLWFSVCRIYMTICSRNLIPVVDELEFETLAYRSAPRILFSAEPRHSTTSKETVPARNSPYASKKALPSVDFGFLQSRISPYPSSIEPGALSSIWIGINSVKNRGAERLKASCRESSAFAAARERRRLSWFGCGTKSSARSGRKTRKHRWSVVTARDCAAGIPLKPRESWSSCEETTGGA
jgi:hypothetical protein